MKQKIKTNITVKYSITKTIKIKERNEQKQITSK